MLVLRIAYGLSDWDKELGIGDYIVLADTPISLRPYSPIIPIPPSLALLFIQIVWFGGLFESGCILIPVVDDICHFVATAEATAYLLATGNLVEHIKASGVSIAFFESSLFGIHIRHFLHYVELYQRQWGSLGIGDIYFHALDVFSLISAIEGLDVYGAEHHSGQGKSVEAASQFLGVGPRCTE